MMPPQHNLDCMVAIAVVVLMSVGCVGCVGALFGGLVVWLVGWLVGGRWSVVGGRWLVLWLWFSPSTHNQSHVQ